jgi:hypothetical protein
MTTKASNKPLQEAAKPAVSGEKAPQIVPNAPEVAQNPVPATERDTPVLIQYSAPDPATTPAPDVPAVAAAPDASRAEALESVKEVVSAALDAVAITTQPTHKTDTTTIKVLRSHPRLGAFPGQTTAINTKLANELIEGGFAVQVSADGEDVKPALTPPSEEQQVLAKAAYARYGAVTDFKNFQGNPMPEFDKLPEAIQCAWAAAASLEYNHKAE